jgi:hypothetical protein
MEVTKENYKQVAEEKKKLVLAYAQSDDGWSHVKTKDDVEISKKKTDDSSHILVRGKGLVPGTVESILAKIAGEKYQTALDPTLISVKVIELLDESDCYKFQYQQNKMPSPLTDRDFVTFQHKELVSKELAVTCATSVVHPQAPVDKHFVRGEVLLGGYVVEKVDEKQCKVTYVVQVSLKGSVPTFVTNTASVDQGLAVLHLRKAMESA